MSTRWGILATGHIAGTFAAALRDAEGCELVAAASRSDAGAAAFASAFPETADHAFPTYEALLEEPLVDAVYVATPHPLHATWAIRALEAGKAVLVEKPMGLNHAECMAITAAAARTGGFLMEAYMYQLHPQTQALRQLIASGAIGEVRHIEARFGFAAPYDPAARLFNPELGGGAILDVGGYPMSMALSLADSRLTTLEASAHLSPEGVDELASALLTFENGVTAQISTAITSALDNTVTVYGTAGSVHLNDPWLPGESWSFSVSDEQGERTESGSSAPLYVLEAEHAAAQIAAGQTESPVVSWDFTLANNQALEQWRQRAGVVYPSEQPQGFTPLPLPRGADEIEKRNLPGLDKPIARLVMGCDNQPSYAHAAVMWDDYVNAGGNTFDTAHIYGGGSMESLLGDWQSQRNLRDEIVIIGKGAHTPDNYPDRVATQLDESLTRLQTDHVDIYFLHRDNLDVPAGEFIDALNAEHNRGRVRLLGASNWTLERIREANAYAAANNLNGFTAISNNFSLARMVEPVWPGVESASTDEFRSFLEDTQIALFPWSAQARGFFTAWGESVINDVDRLQPAVTGAQPTAAELQRVWFSEENFERRRRAVELADQRGVEPINVALAYVLRQIFPTFPLIGPRHPQETASSLASLAVELTSDELAWLDLRDAED